MNFHRSGSAFFQLGDFCIGDYEGRDNGTSIDFATHLISWSKQSAPDSMGAAFDPLVTMAFIWMKSVTQASLSPPLQPAHKIIPITELLISGYSCMAKEYEQTPIQLIFNEDLAGEIQPTHRTSVGF